MNGLGCCLWWFVFGVLLGWLLNWLFSKLFRNNPPASGSGSSNSYTPPRTAAPAPSSTTPASTSALASSGAVLASGAATKLVDLDAARRAGFNLRGADDLAVIDGIGPKIEELFREHGVTKFSQVAVMSVPQLQAILDAGGPHFKLANPATWAQQAQLILDNKWGDLKKLHDELAAVEKAGNPHNHH
jgi:predicted flap endonuclease-1-like 5' DNA nuclease